MRISDWSSDVCSSDLHVLGDPDQEQRPADRRRAVEPPARDVVGAWNDRIYAEVELNEIEGPVDDDDAEDEIQKIVDLQQNELPIARQSLANLIEVEMRSEERRVGQEGGSRWRSRW